MSSLNTISSGLELHENLTTRSVSAISAVEVEKQTSHTLLKAGSSIIFREIGAIVFKNTTPLDLMLAYDPSTRKMEVFDLEGKLIGFIQIGLYVPPIRRDGKMPNVPPCSIWHALNCNIAQQNFSINPEESGYAFDNTYINDTDDNISVELSYDFSAKDGNYRCITIRDDQLNILYKGKDPSESNEPISIQKLLEEKSSTEPKPI